MNPNPTGYPAFQQPANPMFSSPAGYPAVPTQSPHNPQVPFYPTAPIPPYAQAKTPQGHHPMQQQQQQQQQHAFGAVPLQAGAPAGAMMPSGIPQQPSGPHPNFSAPSPYPQTTVATTLAPSSQAQVPSTLPVTTAQAPAQIMTSVSPANNMFPNQQQRPQQQPNQAQAPAQPSAAQAQATARDKARVATLLDINSALLQEVVNLQAAGKAGMPAQAASQPSSAQDQNASPSSSTEQSNNANDASKGQQKPSQEYIECMRRLQANLAYLATIADRAKKSGGVPPSAPAIMTPPPSLPSMNEMYAKLNELFPGAAKGPISQQQQQQQQQKPGQQAAMQGNGGPSPAPAGDAAV